MIKRKRKIPDYKLKQVKELAELISSKNSVLIASIKGLPAKNFQKIKKSLNDKSIIKILKKRTFFRVLDASNNNEIKKIKEYFNEDSSILISDLDVFELASIINKNKSPIKAKAGQISNQDIEIKAGVTEIPAGPAVSEFGNLGLQVKVTSGKIEIMKSKTIVKKGELISENVASVLGKLDINPFSVGFIPLVGFDVKSGKIYTTLTIDKEELLNEIRENYIKAQNLAVNINYISKDTIPFLLRKAANHKEVLEKFLKNSQINSGEEK
ncbi:MAG: 50S ribosomal protein L10 [Candidatus Pacearchaeota archaeon]